MMSPNPLFIVCALLLCLPLAFVFTTITTSTTAIHKHNPTPLVLEKPEPHLKTIDPTMKLQEPAAPPPPVGYDADDEALFRMASHVKVKRNIGPRKIAFMFMTTAPLPFAPLWESYFNKTPKNLFNIYIHADPGHSYDPPFSGVFFNRVIPSKHTERYSPTLISAARRLLARALMDDLSNYMFVLLSSSCIPLHSFNFTYHALVNSEKSFVEILENEIGTYDRWAARGADAMPPEVKLEDFRLGSQFWALTRKHARLVVSDRKIWPKFNMPCVLWYTCYPEESYFPTLLGMWDSKGCVHATLTHVDWTGRHDGHPRTYEPSYVGPELIMKLRSDTPRYGDGNGKRRCDPFLFARKFAADALQPLMDIANDVVFRD